jgi:hypothetical protein
VRPDRKVAGKEMETEHPYTIQRKKRSVEVRQILNTGNVFEEMGKARRQNRCRQVVYIQKHSIYSPIG